MVDMDFNNSLIGGGTLVNGFLETKFVQKFKFSLPDF